MSLRLLPHASCQRMKVGPQRDRQLFEERQLRVKELFDMKMKQIEETDK